MSTNSSPNDLPQEISQLATHAVQFDRDGNIEVAIYYYTEAAKSLLEAQHRGIPFPGLDAKLKEYRDRAAKLKEQRNYVDIVQFIFQ